MYIHTDNFYNVYRRVLQIARSPMALVLQIARSPRFVRQAMDAYLKDLEEELPNEEDGQTGNAEEEPAAAEMNKPAAAGMQKLDKRIHKRPAAAVMKKPAAAEMNKPAVEDGFVCDSCTEVIWEIKFPLLEMTLAQAAFEPFWEMVRNS